MFGLFDFLSWFVYSDYFSSFFPRRQWLFSKNAISIPSCFKSPNCCYCLLNAIFVRIWIINRFYRFYLPIYRFNCGLVNIKTQVNDFFWRHHFKKSVSHVLSFFVINLSSTIIQIVRFFTFQICPRTIGKSFPRFDFYGFTTFR